MKLQCLHIVFIATTTLAADPTTPPNTIPAELFFQVRTSDSPTTQPATPQMPEDPAMTDLLDLGTRPATQSADVPATQPASPLVDEARPDDSRPATLTLSNGQVLRGRVATTTDRPIRIWDETIKDYRDIPFHLVKSAVALVVWERDEAEWVFRESGSDIKTYTGKTYPARETQYVITLLNGETITGGVVAPLFWDSDGQQKTYVLHKRDKGEVGKKLADLVYVKKLELLDEKPK